jgi:hypothetical protein
MVAVLYFVISWLLLVAPERAGEAPGAQTTGYGRCGMIEIKT